MKTEKKAPTSRQVYLPSGKRVSIDFDDGAKLDEICAHHALKPTELVRWLIRKEYKQIFE